MSPELARALDTLVALLDALEERIGTDELLPEVVVDEARATYNALAAADRQPLAPAWTMSGPPTRSQNR